jgi:hypothetical protein
MVAKKDNWLLGYVYKDTFLKGYYAIFKIYITDCEKARL